MPFQAVIPHPSGGGAQVRVRSIPIVAEPDQPPIGWTVYLAETGGDAGAPVLFHGMWTRDARMKELFRIVEQVADQGVVVGARARAGAGHRRQCTRRGRVAHRPRQGLRQARPAPGGGGRLPARVRARRRRWLYPRGRAPGPVIRR